MANKIIEFMRRKKGGNKMLGDYTHQEMPTENGNVLMVRTRPDTVFLVLTLILILIGTVMSFSASTAYASQKYGNSFLFLTEHLGHLLIAFVPAAIITFILTPQLARLLAVGTYALSILLLIAVLIVGITGGGARRWIDLGFFTFQPSELAKTGIIMLLALYMTKHEDAVVGKGFNRRSIVHGFIVPVAIIGLVCVLVGLEKHFSGIIIIGCIGVVMMFISGTNIFYFISCVPVAGLLGFLIMQTGYARARVDSWLNRGADALGSDWQTTQGLYAIGTGGLFGLGLGQSRLKYGYVSQPQNDFVFTVVCEELGFFGAVAILILFLALAWRGFILASHAADKFCSLVIFGLSFKLAIHVLLNIGVVTGVLPNTGVALPFFSSGGSATLIQLFDAGIILGLSRFCTQKQ
jgi:cell division protein FtsW